jgi:hypothetical protein
MKKILVLLASMFLLVGCVESMALLGPATGATNGKIVQASAKSAISFGIKKKTGKSPIQHALAYVKEKNPDKKKEKCISFIEKTNSEACAIAKKQVALAQTKIKGIIAEKKISFKKQFAQARKEGKNSFIFNNKIYNTTFKKSDVTEKKVKPKKSAMELAIIVQAKIKEKSKIKYLD